MMINVQAPAKINLFLSVGGLLPNNLHEMESVILSLDMYDILTITDGDSLFFICDEPSISKESNLAFKAATMLRQKFNIERGATIELKKRIPIAAGLGGGSSDAAAVLKGLNGLWELGLSTEKLAEFAAALGSDVSYFLEQGCGLVRGYGQIVTGVNCGNIGSLFFVLGNPGVRLATEAVYRRYDVSSTSGNRGATGVLEALKAGSGRRLAESIHNDLEAAAIDLCPEIMKVKKAAIENGALKAMVSGSGPTVFALCQSEREAKVVEASMANVAPFTRICRAVT